MILSKAHIDPAHFLQSVQSAVSFDPLENLRQRFMSFPLGIVTVYALHTHCPTMLSSAMTIDRDAENDEKRYKSAESPSWSGTVIGMFYVIDTPVAASCVGRFVRLPTESSPP